MHCRVLFTTHMYHRSRPIIINMETFMPDDAPWTEADTYNCLNRLLRNPEHYNEWVHVWLRPPGVEHSTCSGI